MKKGFLIVIALFFTLKVLAQTNGNSFSLPTVMSPAPQSAALGRYGDIPVSINTGVPNISIPLYTITSGKLSLPISINYHASGVKVMDMASPTGLGWALSAGGDISRVVQGQPDESMYGFPATRVPYANDPSLAAKEKCLANNMCNSYNTSINAWDGQPDLFFFSVGEKSGQFLSKNSVSNFQQPSFITIPYYPINIAVTNVYQNFTITDDDGTQYFFNRLDSSATSGSTSSRIITYATAWHLVKMRSADKADSIIFKYGTVSRFGYTTNLSRNLQLNYNNLGTPTFFNYTSATNSTINTTEYLLSEIDFNNGKVTMDYSSGYASNQTMILNAVHLFNMQNGNYREIKRFSLYHSSFMNNSVIANVSRLDSIKETGFYNNNTVQKPSIVFSYFSYGGYQCPPFNSFAQDFWGYFNGQASNADMNFVVSGMSNGTPSVPVAVVAPAKRLPDSNYVKVGSLLSIKYPTGGVTNLTLEANQIAVPVTQDQTVTNPPSLNVYISNFGASANSTAGFSSTFTVDTTFAAVYSSGNGPLFNAQLTFQVSPRCTAGSTNCVSDQAFVQLNDVTSGTPGPIVSELMVNSPSSTTSSTQTALFNLIQGHTYTLYFPYQPVLPNNSSNFQYRLDANVTAYKRNSTTVVTVTIAPTCLTGGLRVKLISSSDGNGHSLIKQYSYPGSYFNSSLFNGNYSTLAANFAFKGLVLGGGSTGGPGAFVLGSTTYSPNLSLPLGSVSNNAISYNEVVEYESDGNSNHNGKTVYDYNSLADIVTMNMPFFRISNENARALLTEKRIYKNQSGGYSLLQDVVNNYTNLDSSMPNADTVTFYTAHALFLDNTLNGNPAYSCLGCSTYSTANQFLINRYFYTTSRYVLASSSVTDIDNNNNALTTGTTYNYQNPVHAFPTHTNTVNSERKNIDTYMTYVLDQVASPSCTNSCASNLSTQLKSLNTTYFSTFSNEYTKYSQWQNSNGTFITSNGALTGVLTTAQQDSVIVYENAYAQSMTNYQNAVDALVNSYNSCVNSYNTCLSNYYTSTANPDQKGIIDLQAQNNILSQIQNTRYTNGVLNTTLQNYFQSYHPGITKPSRVMFSTMNNPLESRLVFNQYDTHGNIQQVQKTFGEFHSYIWDYQNTYPIAEVQNATPADIAYTSFEADGSGNWTIGSVLRDTVTAAITGSKSYVLNNGPISIAELTASTTYIVSYWTKNTVPYTIAGFVSGSAKQGATINGWTYFETQVTGVTSLTISGSNNIDELRLYPSAAQMTTSTYTPLVGMTSQCGTNNKITYYQYDGLQRLSDIQDQYGNIIKHIDYHYQGQ